MLIGDKAGDAAQLRVLAAALGWPVREVELKTNAWRNLPNVILGESLLSSRVALAPPWPDVVLWAGRRGTPIARWIRRANGGRTRLVNLGRPWAPYGAIDLVIGMPQYRPPSRSNVFVARLPFNRQCCVSRPGDRVVLLVGGPAPPLAFGVGQARRIREEACALAMSLGKPLLVVASRRTPRAVADVLGASDVSYAEALSRAARIVVTGDSASMIADALSTGRPVDIAPLPYARAPLSLLARGIDAVLPSAQSAGLWERPRDMPSLWRALVEGGHVAMLGGPEPSSRVPFPDDLPEAVARIRALVLKQTETKPA
ncbi:MAG: mitochondrial fission ELM1 family protein [Alphaproteobacteria bacterium]|nr:mitochondrial fission ELM1 family protein [Alphaproteobacteria bacterium]MCW5742058.1 mitochondrial fission ELM1 family protein [Alphaproteobacteria bacterium]